MTIFGITIPLWAIIAGLVLLYLFRNEVREVLIRFVELLGLRAKPRQPDPQVNQLVLQALAARGVVLGDAKDFDGQRLVQVLKAFHDFLGVIANVTPNKVDDVAVRFINIFVRVLENNPDIADMIARFINLFVVRHAAQEVKNENDGNKA
jgi:hypothetical protein